MGRGGKKWSVASRDKIVEKPGARLWATEDIPAPVPTGRRNRRFIEVLVESGRPGEVPAPVCFRPLRLKSFAAPPTDPWRVRCTSAEEDPARRSGDHRKRARRTLADGPDPARPACAVLTRVLASHDKSVKISSKLGPRCLPQQPLTNERDNCPDRDPPGTPSIMVLSGGAIGPEKPSMGKSIA